MAASEPPLAELFQVHRNGLAGAVRSVAADADVTELLQEAFVRCWRAWQRGTRPDDPVAWIFVVTWNVARDALRARRRRPAHASLNEDQMPIPATEPSPSHALEQRETVALARAAVARLADAEQQVFLLRIAGERTFESIAAALAIPVGTAKTRMRSALQKLRAALGAAPSATEERR